MVRFKLLNRITVAILYFLYPSSNYPLPDKQDHKLRSGMAFLSCSLVEQNADPPDMVDYVRVADVMKQR